VPLGKTCTNRLVQRPRRQAPSSDRPTVAGFIAWQNTPCRQVPRGAGTFVEVLSPDAILVAKLLLIFMHPTTDWPTAQAIPEI